MRPALRGLLPYAPYAALSAVHVIARFAEHPSAGPTKLLLMPALAAGVVWAASRAGMLRRRAPGAMGTADVPRAPGAMGTADVPRAGGAIALLVASIACSWLGDGSSTFFPMFDDELPMMLLCFGMAHVAYVLLMWRAAGLAVRGLPQWSLVYGAAYLVLIAALVPHTGGLTIPVMVYGLLLVGTAALASRCGAVIAAGGAWFLLSDAILAFLVFVPQAMPPASGGMVMLTYTLGQGLLAGGIVAALARRGSGGRITGTGVSRAAGSAAS